MFLYGVRSIALSIPVERMRHRILGAKQILAGDLAIGGVAIVLIG
jgi:hypothetical protein